MYGSPLPALETSKLLHCSLSLCEFIDTLLLSRAHHQPQRLMTATSVCPLPASPGLMLCIFCLIQLCNLLVDASMVCCFFLLIPKKKPSLAFCVSCNTLRPMSDLRMMTRSIPVHFRCMWLRCRFILTHLLLTNSWCPRLRG